MTKKPTINKGVDSFIKNLRASLPYLEKFYNEIFVIKFSGYTLQQDNFSSLLDDLILLRRIGIKIILVHGAAPQVNDLIKLNGHSGGYKDGELFISPTTFPIAQRAIAATNWELITKLSNYGSDFFPITGHFLYARKKSMPDSPGAKFIGEIKDINMAAIHNVLEQNYIPIISPLSAGKYSGQYLLDPNHIGLEVAARIRAKKLIIVSSENGDLKHQLEDSRQYTTLDIKSWLNKGTINNKLTENQLSVLVQACERGVERCHLLDGSIDGILLGEILTSSGVGMMITNHSFQTVRQAQIGDIHMIAEILKKPVLETAVLSKSYHYLEEHIENFIVFSIDSEAVGCCELITYEENQSVELATLAVKESHRNRGIGKQLVRAAIEQAIQRRRKLLFALTTTAGHLFTAMGFTIQTPAQLPERKREKYDFSESIIFAKFLN